jgi:SAM-dependent methyltransferase
MAEDPLATFRHIYQTAHWQGGSGQGSRAEVTTDYRPIVERLIGASDVRSVVDAGCGDWEFARLIDWSPVSYVGVDIVPEVITADRDAFGSDAIAFECRDLMQDSLPAGDALLCKDVLQHWPLEWIHSFVARVTSTFRYVLLTNDVSSVHSPPEMQNADIAVGAWRTLDLESAPFGLNAQWRHDYDVRGEWLKRTLLFVRPRYRVAANLRRGSALRRLRAVG